MCTILIALVLAGSTNARQFDSNSLPEPVQEMRNALLDAAESGNIAEMQIPVELNEMPPVINGASPAAGEAVSALRNLIPDADGRAILLVLLKILTLPAAKAPDDSQMFVWPYLATRDLRTLSANEQADLLRLIPQADALAMMRSGTYTHYHLEIGDDGTWHFFGRGK